MFLGVGFPADAAKQGWNKVKAAQWDATAGYPGEGPATTNRMDEDSGGTLLLSGGGCCLRAAGGLATFPVDAGRMAALPATPAAGLRRSGLPPLLPDGRPNPVVPPQASLGAAAAGRLAQQAPCVARAAAITAQQIREALGLVECRGHPLFKSAVAKKFFPPGRASSVGFMGMGARRHGGARTRGVHGRLGDDVRR